MYRKGDWFSVIALAAVIALLAFFRFSPLEERGLTLLIEAVGEVREYRVRPNDATTLEVEGSLGNTLVRIQDGQAWIAHSPCPDKVCLLAGKIPGDTDIIVCRPNAVTLRRKD